MTKKGFKKMKFGVPPFVKGVREFVSRQMGNLAVVAVFLFVVVLCAQAFFYKSDYFRVRSVQARGFADQAQSSSIARELLKAYGNKNIFQVNVEAVAASLQKRYQDARCIIVKRDLPDRLAVFAYFRRPFALVNSSRLYPVDEDGIVIWKADPASLGGLTVINGVEIGPRSAPGTREGKGLKLALDLLKEINKAKFLAAYGLTSISAGDARNLSFYLKNGVEVRIGYERFKDRLALLKKVLKDPRLLLDKIKYIDLRFGDVAIGPR
ncbi:MAG: cell division protein FtsQ/DivIB [Candidatus Omnitrophica bacterium]|nr:cell division protein FtsQ/DivIB [Candidatus Omnitrophota bacterium]